MGHCVGGYCDDVASGRTKIYSLRDAKGKPHATVEVSKPDLQDAAMREQWLASDRDIDYDKWLEASYPDRFNELNVPRIKQIKGFKNQAPDASVQPFVQDFVRSGKWSDVGDLQNTGLRRVTEQGLRGKLGDFVTDDEWAKHMEGFASGGRVQLPPSDRPPPTLGTRGRSELPADAGSGYNSPTRPTWDIFGTD
jgi:hypothetical protein